MCDKRPPVTFFMDLIDSLKISFTNLRIHGYFFMEKNDIALPDFNSFSGIRRKHVENILVMLENY